MIGDDALESEQYFELKSDQGSYEVESVDIDYTVKGNNISTEDTLLKSNKIPKGLCRLCGFLCVNKDHLKEHLTSVHGGDFVEFCFECGKGFKSLYGYRTHRTMQHQGSVKDRYCPQCQICGKFCVNNSNLASHLRSHSEYRPFHCLVCDKSYKHKRDFRDHPCKPISK